MFGIISEFKRLKRFYEFANNMLHERTNYLGDNFMDDSEVLFEDYEMTTNLMMTQIVAITSDALRKNDRLRTALLSSFSRKSVENVENLKSFFNHSSNMAQPSEPIEESRKEMYYHVGKWTIDMVSAKNAIHDFDFSKEYITEIGAMIYNISLEAAMNSKLIK